METGNAAVHSFLFFIWQANCRKFNQSELYTICLYICPPFKQLRKI